MIEKNTLTLAKPITAHNEPISILEFREPTGRDVRELGYPYQLNQDDSITLLAGVTAKYIVRLAGIPMSAVDEMSAADLNVASHLVSSFFHQK